MGLIKKLLPDSFVKKKYVDAGATFGYAVSYLYLGECAGFEALLNKWAEWEEEYAHRGFKTVSLDRFGEFGGYGKPIDEVLGRKREVDEEPIFHAQIYREKFLGKVLPAINLKELLNGVPQSGEYILPSTEE